jgi:hypothetical protein
MERMEANTATVRVEDRVGQQMIDVNQHGRQNQQTGPLPLIAPKQPREQKRGQKMAAIVEYEL